MNRFAAVRPLLVAAFALSLLAYSPARAECFWIYTANNVLASESGTSPIDLSKSISEEMARRFPSRHLVISTTSNCGDSALSGAAPTRFGGVGDFAGTSPSSAGRRETTNPYDAPVRTRRRR